MSVGLNSIAALPIVTVAVGAILLVVLDLLRGRGSSLLVSVVVVAVALGFSMQQFPFVGSTTALGSLVYVDRITSILYVLILLGTLAAILLNAGNLNSQRVQPTADIDALILLSGCGAMVMVSAANLIVLFLGFELLSVAVYVLAGVARGERASTEGALKYFIQGAFSSAFLLYGMVLVYAVTGTMVLHEIGQVLQTLNSFPLLLFVGLGLLVFGLAFKVSLVPFHFWTPDAYQGAPVSIVVFMAVVVKVAAFGAFIRLMAMSFGDLHAAWDRLLWVLAAVTMTVGNLAALRQESVKRLLAYSSIAHAGYAMLGLVSNEWGSTIFYLAVYSFMTVASFGVVLVVSAGSDAQYDRDSINSLAGVGWSSPLLGLVMTIAVLSLAGMPPLAGFFGKLYLFQGAVEGGYPGLAIIAAVNSVISLAYYLRILVVMYFSSVTSVRTIGVSVASSIVLGLATAGSCFTGLGSNWLLWVSRSAAENLSSVEVSAHLRTLGLSSDRRSRF